VAAGNVIPDATLALLYQRQGAGFSNDPFKLANFLKKGGKVIMYHGGSDPVLSPFLSTSFYEELASLHDGYRHTQDSARLFIVPGMGHCGGGVAPNSFDTLQALDNRVGYGRATTRSRQLEALPPRTRQGARSTRSSPPSRSNLSRHS
jgi:feruloyl esterase